MPPIESGFSVLDRRPCFKLLLTRRTEKFSDGTDVLTCFSLPRLGMYFATMLWTKPASNIETVKFRTTCIWFDPLPVTTPNRQA